MTLGFSVSPSLPMDLFSDVESDPLTWRDSEVMFPGMQHYPSVSDDLNKPPVAQDVDVTGPGGCDLKSMYHNPPPYQYESGPRYCDRPLANRLNPSSLLTAYNAEPGEGRRVGRKFPSVITNTLRRPTFHQPEEIRHEQLFRDYHDPAHSMRTQGDVVPLVYSQGCSSNPSGGAQIPHGVENPPELSGGLPCHPAFAFQGEYEIQFGWSSGAMDVLLDADTCPAAKAAIETHALYPYVVAAHVDCYKVGADPADVKSIEEATLKHRHLQPKNNNYVPSLDTKQELDKVMGGYLRMLVDLKEKLEASFATEKQWCDDMFKKLKLFPSWSPIKPTGYDAEGQRSAAGNEGSTSVIGDIRQTSLFWDDRGDGPIFISEDVKRAKELKEYLRSKHNSRQIFQLRGQCRKKRRQGKHSQDARELLVQWFERHGEWPYPSEEEKIKLARETQLETRQINNWFINQRKRHWDCPSKEETNVQIGNELMSFRQIAHREKTAVDPFYVPLNMFNASQNPNFT